MHYSGPFSYTLLTGRLPRCAAVTQLSLTGGSTVGHQEPWTRRSTVTAMAHADWKRPQTRHSRSWVGYGEQAKFESSKPSAQVRAEEEAEFGRL